MATYNLFPSDPPATTAATDTGSTITSTEFVVTATCWVVQIRWFRPNSTITGARTAQIWRQDSQTAGTAIGPQHPLPMPEAESWGTYDLPEAIELAPGRYRIAVMHSLGRFQRANNYYAAGNPGATAYTNGPITRVAGGNVAPARQAAWVASSSNVFPSAYSASGYFDDVVVSDVKPAPAPGLGEMKDYLSRSFTDTAGSTSLYHMYAAGRTAAPNGLVVQLHGDGAGEFVSPLSGTLAGYNNVALANNMLMLAPRSPDNVGIRTWWENTASPVWLLALLDYIRTQYAIDENKIWFMGYSGGAEVQTYFLLSDYSNRIGNGGNIMLGGGGASGLIMGRQPTSAFKANQRLHWAVGALDTDDGTGWNALAAAQGGFDRYGTEGFAKRTFETIPGEGHLASEDDGPRILAEQLALAYPSVTRSTTGTAAAKASGTSAATTVRRSSRAAPAIAATAGVTSATRRTSRTAPVSSQAAAATKTVRGHAGTAEAKATAASTTNAAANTSGAATVTATAASTSGKFLAMLSSALARAKASSTSRATRRGTGTATATATADSTPNAVRSRVETAAVKAAASSTSQTYRRPEVTAAAGAIAAAGTATQRTKAATAEAHANTKAAATATKAYAGTAAAVATAGAATFPLTGAAGLASAQARASSDTVTRRTFSATATATTTAALTAGGTRTGAADAAAYTAASADTRSTRTATAAAAATATATAVSTATATPIRVVTATATAHASASGTTGRAGTLTDHTLIVGEPTGHHFEVLAAYADQPAP